MIEFRLVAARVFRPSGPQRLRPMLTPPGPCCCPGHVCRLQHRRGWLIFPLVEGTCLYLEIQLFLLLPLVLLSTAGVPLPPLLSRSPLVITGNLFSGSLPGLSLHTRLSTLSRPVSPALHFAGTRFLWYTLDCCADGASFKLRSTRRNRLIYSYLMCVLGKEMTSSFGFKGLSVVDIFTVLYINYIRFFFLSF